MTDNPFDAGPLSDIRTTVAAQIAAVVTDATVFSEWQAPAGASVILHGGGWSQLTGCGMIYQLKVTCAFGNSSGIAQAHTEELTRQVYDALRQNEYQCDPVPPTGKIVYNSREYPACQITVKIPLNPS